MSESTDPDELRALLKRVASVGQDSTDAVARATKAMKQLTAAWNAGVAQDVAQHPDLAELNVQLDGFYDGPVRPGEEPTA